MDHLPQVILPSTLALHLQLIPPAERDDDFSRDDSTFFYLWAKELGIAQYYIGQTSMFRAVFEWFPIRCRHYKSLVARAEALDLRLMYDKTFFEL